MVGEYALGASHGQHGGEAVESLTCGVAGELPVTNRAEVADEVCDARPKVSVGRLFKEFEIDRDGESETVQITLDGVVG
jgi:hypothetical protein